MRGRWPISCRSSCSSSGSGSTPRRSFGRWTAPGRRSSCGSRRSGRRRCRTHRRARRCSPAISTSGSEGRMTPIPIDSDGVAMRVYSVLPEIVVVATALFILFLDVVLPEENRRVLCWVSFFGVAIALYCVFAMGTARIDGFSGMISRDGLGAFIDMVILTVCALTLLMATGYSDWEGTHKGEFYSLLLLSTSGMMIMAKGTDLMTVFLGLETMSIPIYVLLLFHRNRMSSIEGALKYFLLGAFASGFLLYGIALMYAATGT